MDKKDKTLAGVLSLLIPGLGQVYAGKVGRGIAWFIAVGIGYMLFVIPGVILWVVNIWDAVDIVKKQNSKIKK